VSESQKELLEKLAELLKPHHAEATKEAGEAGRKAWQAVTASAVAAALSIAASVVSVYAAKVQEVHNDGRELREMVEKLAEAEAKHKLGSETNIIAKQAYGLTIRLMEADKGPIGWLVCHLANECGDAEISVPELAFQAYALYDADDQGKAEELAHKAVERSGGKDEASLDRSLAKRVLATVLLGDHKEGWQQNFKEALTDFEYPKEKWVAFDNAKTEIEWTRAAASISYCEMARQRRTCLERLMPHLLGDDRTKVLDMIKARHLDGPQSECHAESAPASSKIECFEPILNDRN
jgi:hypothetical protein